MSKLRKKQRYKMNGKVIAKLSFYEGLHRDFIGFKFDELIGKTTEKAKGLFMVDKIKRYFGLNDNDLSISKEQLRAIDEMDFEDIKRQQSLQEQINKKIEWTRDEKGNIISPFDKPKTKFK